MPHPKGKRLDVQELKNLLQQRDMSTASLKQRAGVSQSTVDRALRGDPLSERQRRKISTALNTNTIRLLHPEERMRARQVRSGTNDPLAGLSERKNRSEIKNIIDQQTVSERLLGGEVVPISECVHATRMMTPTDPEQKDQPLPGWKYVHYFQLGSLIGVKDARGVRFVIYLRERIPGTPQFEYVKGWACCWGASYQFRSSRDDSEGLMDDWIECVRQDPEAARELLTGDSPPSLKLFSYKIRVHDLSTRVQPLGLITNDFRDANGSGRVYTQAVFQVVILDLDGVPSSEQEIAERAAPIHVELVESTGFSWQERFVDAQKDRPNLIDQLTWQASFIEPSAKKLERGTAKFVRLTDDHIVAG